MTQVIRPAVEQWWINTHPEIPPGDHNTPPHTLFPHSEHTQREEDRGWRNTNVISNETGLLLVLWRAGAGGGGGGGASVNFICWLGNGNWLVQRLGKGVVKKAHAFSLSLSRFVSLCLSLSRSVCLSVSLSLSLSRSLRLVSQPAAHTFQNTRKTSTPLFSSTELCK